MSKLKLFLLADGAIVVVGLIFFAVLYFRRGQSNAFRDDLWEKKKRAQEDLIDKKIQLEYKPDPKDPDEKPKAANPSQQQPKPEFNYPNFYGKPHEILGIPKISTKDQITRAYKHWIKRYHPDKVAHLGGKAVEQARRRSEQLNSAREALLKTVQ